MPCCPWANGDEGVDRNVHPSTIAASPVVLQEVRNCTSTMAVADQEDLLTRIIRGEPRKSTASEIRNAATFTRGYRVSACQRPEKCASCLCAAEASRRALSKSGHLADFAKVPCTKMNVAMQSSRVRQWKRKLSRSRSAQTICHHGLEVSLALVPDLTFRGDIKLNSRLRLPLDDRPLTSPRTGHCPWAGSPVATPSRHPIRRGGFVLRANRASLERAARSTKLSI